jgi:hypothetical protein
LARRNYNAFLRASRRAGLSLPSARRAYKIVSERLGRSAKGKDVAAHPRIFKEATPVKEGGRKPARGSSGARAITAVRRAEKKEAARAGVVSKGRAVSPPRKSTRGAMGETPARPKHIVNIDNYLDAKEQWSIEDVEYASTAEY